MSEWKDFDEHIKNQFRNFSPEVSPEIWEKIVSKRDKRRPAGFWFNLYSTKGILWIAAILAISIIGGKFLFSSSSFEQKQSVVNTSQKTTTSSGTNPGINLNKNNAADQTTTGSTTNDNNLKNNISNNTTPSVADNSSANNIKSSTTQTIASGSNNNVNGYTKNKKAISKYKSDVYSVENNVSAKGTSPSTFGSRNRLLLSYKRKIKSKVNYSNNNYGGIETIPGASNTTEDIADINASKDQTENYLRNELPGSVEESLFEQNTLSLSLKEKKSPAVNLPECPTIEKDAAANKQYIDFYIGPDYGIRTLTDTANTLYLQKRNASSQFVSGFSTGVRYTKVFSNGMSLRGALNFSQINERFSYIQGSIIQTTYIINPFTGDTTGSYTVRGTRYLTTYNHYRSIDIPITIGYELGNGKFHANINVGVIANIYSWQKGDILDTNYQPVDITTGKGSSFYQFKTNVGLGATGGVSFYYKITDQLHALAEPYFRYNFSPMSNNNLTLRQKYTTIGLRLGIRFDLH